MNNTSRLTMTMVSVLISNCVVNSQPFEQKINIDDGMTSTAEPTPTIGLSQEQQARLVEIPLASGYGFGNEQYEIYFTDPGSPLASQETGGLDGPLVEAIDSTRLSIDLAMYSIKFDNIRAALQRAEDRGVRIRIVMESEFLPDPDPQMLMGAGIPVVGDGREGLMHNKFMILDGAEAWTGSLNFTTSGIYEDHNDLIRIRSIDAAEDYTREFEEMFLDGQFGADIQTDTPHTRVLLNEIPVDVYFSPDDQVEDALMDLIANANESIYFMAFAFTSDPLGQALRQRANEGVVVRGFVDADQEAFLAGSEFIPFQQAGLDVRLDGNPGQMHHKVLIIDGEIVVMGSYNFTKSAEENNDENLLVVFDEEIADKFLEEFQRVMKKAKQ